MLQNLSIVRKGLLVILLPILCQTALLGLLFRRQAEVKEAQTMALHTKEVLLQIDRIVSVTLQIQSGLLGYAMTGSDAYRADEQKVIGEVTPLMETLRGMVSDNPEQSRRAEALQRAAQRRVEWNKRMDGLMREGRIEEVQAAFKSLEGKELIDKLLTEVDSFRRTEEGLDQRRLKALENQADLQSRILTLGILATILAGVAAMIILTRGLTQRIEVLRANARRFSRGETLAPLVEGRDEIAELDVNFHEMADAIAEGQRNERTFQATLEKQNAELVTANLDLDHKSRENEMFVYSVSHDLRSPLVNLLGFSRELGTARDSVRQMLEGEMDAETRGRALRIIDRDITEPIRFIQTAVTRLSSIIDALLRLSRVGRVEYKGEAVDLNPVMKRIQDAMSGQIAAKGAELTVQPLPPTFGDATALEQIFANLIGNAVNYLDPARPGRVEIGVVENPAGESEGMQVFFVKDNGLGIPDAYLPKVFTIFQRLHGNVAPGEGIGLALVRRMVERHGGRIWVESEVKVGSTFFVALPLLEKSPLKVAPKKESIKLTGSTPDARRYE
ncbi:MAG TPA: ATP-binding protein [Chthoniobacteraceae bacterium]|jgi:signal transduction histidine kinase|nr:ATP-binding protein [Chthoniobacteraceae bacterium]